MIASFANAVTEELWTKGKSRKIPAGINRRASIDLRSVSLPRYTSQRGLTICEHLPATAWRRWLEIGRPVQHSRQQSVALCFHWLKDNAHDVEIVDYHLLCSGVLTK